MAQLISANRRVAAAARRLRRVVDPRQLVLDYRDVIADRFDDFDLLDTSGELLLNGPIPAVERLRLELAQEDYLHLATVAVSASGLTDPVRQTRRNSSSTWNNYGKTLADGILFDPANRRTAFHTRRENRPYLDITFDRPYDVERLLLRNRPDPTSRRARGLQVLTRSAQDGVWTTRLDLMRRERDLVAASERFVRRRVRDRQLAASLQRKQVKTSIGTVESELVRILDQIMLRDDGTVDRDLGRIRIDPITAATFRNTVSELILARRQLEWTSHGIRRSFRYWSRPDQQRYLGFARTELADLDQLSPHTAFGFGSVLGIVRHQGLIPHDDDLDLLIAFEPDQAPNIAAGVKQVEDLLRAKGYTVAGDMLAHRWISKPGQTKVDVFVGIFEGDEISWYPGRRGSFTRSMIFPTHSISTLDTDCPVPRETHRYLAEVYGPRWSDPDPDFRHQWGRTDYADIAG
jgi:hypothetical protein